MLLAGPQQRALVILIDVVVNHRPAQNLSMLLFRITGAQLHAARALVGLSRDDLAVRAQLCRHSIRKWEISSNAAPDAMVGHLSRALDVLEGRGCALPRPACSCSVLPPSWGRSCRRR